MARLFEWARTHRLLFGLVVLIWLGTCIFLMPGLERLTSSSQDFENPRSPNVTAREEIGAATGIDPDATVIVMQHLDQSVNSMNSTRLIQDITDKLNDSRYIADSQSFLDDRNPAFVSQSGDATVVIGQLAPYTASEETAVASEFTEAFADTPGVTLGGSLIANYEINEMVLHDLIRAEMIAFPLVFILAFLIFGGLISSLLPVLGGMFTVFSTFGLLVLINNNGLDLSTFALNITIGLGMGLTIDYTLLMLYRYREEIARGLSPIDATRRTVQTAGRTVASSSSIVALSMICLTIFPQRFLYSMGIGGALAALFAGIFATTLLPVLLVSLGKRLDWLSISALRRRRNRQDAEAAQAGGGAWYRLSHWVTRHAVIVAVVSATILIVAGLPFLRVAFTGISTDMLPASSPTRVVDEQLTDEFTLPDATGYALLTSLTPINRITEINHVSLTGPPQELADGRYWVNFALDVGVLDPDGVQAVREVKEAVGSYGMVGGRTASFIDLQTDLVHRLPPVTILLLMISIGTIMVMTMSLILPFKSVLMSALMLSATFGVLVLVFQDGRFEGILRYTSQHALESTQPLLLGVIILALSTDYSVFLLTRIKEYVDAGVSSTEAVALGLQRTGAVVTAAAILLAIAIGAFSTSSLVFIKIIGVGAAAAVLMDAFVIRLFLVPSLMALLGKWNWWAPKGLRKMLGEVNARVGEREVEAPVLPGTPSTSAPDRSVADEEIAAEVAPTSTHSSSYADTADTSADAVTSTDSKDLGALVKLPSEVRAEHASTADAVNAPPSGRERIRR